MTLQQLIKQYKQQSGVSYEFIAKSVGVTKSTVSRWASGDIRKIQGETKQRLSLLLGKDVQSLLDASSYTKPIIGIVKAGYNMLADENIIGYEEVSANEMHQGDYYLKVSGDSMQGARIMDGDLVYVKQCDDVESGDIAVILIGNDEATIKRVIKKDQLLILEAANPNYENRYFTGKEIEELPVRIIGKVLYTKITF